MEQATSMEAGATLKGQVCSSAADVYEEFFVPALFGEWGHRVADAAAIGKGERVLDVACGTGVLAKAMLRKVHPSGLVVGLDRNEGMLEVARRSAPDIDWRLGMAESLPFSNDYFDAVASQFGLMFFEDRVAALSEMYRVLRPGRHLVLAVWDRMDALPGYEAMTALLQRLFGDQVLAACEAPFNMGDLKDLEALLTTAGLTHARIDTQTGTVRFPSIEAWAHTDVKGWTLADIIDDAQFELLLAEARVELKRFALKDGSVTFASSAHIVTIAKR